MNSIKARSVAAVNAGFSMHFNTFFFCSFSGQLCHSFAPRGEIRDGGSRSTSRTGIKVFDRFDHDHAPQSWHEHFTEALPALCG